jgi:hypothetical protein
VGTGTDVYLSVCCIFTGSVRIQKGDVISGCFMSQFSILASMDVTSLYTNIPHNDGIGACREAWDQRAVKEPPTECLVQLLTLVHKHSNCTFNGERV